MPRNAKYPRLLMIVSTAFFSIYAAPSGYAQVSNGMSCSQAVATYERNGRINTTTRSGTTLPLYGGVPVSQRSTLRCPTTGIKVTTKDNPGCIIAYQCMPNGGRGNR
jgi:hypothetical protein